MNMVYAAKYALYVLDFGKSIVSMSQGLWFLGGITKMLQSRFCNTNWVVVILNIDE